MNIPEVKKYDHGNCFGCGKVVEPEDKAFGFPYVRSFRGKTSISLWMCCHSCQEMDEAILEANTDQRRFTPIGVGIGQNHFYSGARCTCGSVTHALKGFCIQCWRAHRMLGKVEAENRLLFKAVKELRSEIRAKLKETADQLN